MRCTKSCIYSQKVLLRMGEFVTRNMLDWFIKINKRKGCCILLVVYIVLKANIWPFSTYRVSQEESARRRDSVPYVKVYRYNPKHLYPKLNGYGDNGQRKVRSSCGSTYCTCLDVTCIPKCAVSKVKSVIQYCLIFMFHVKCLET